MAILVTGGAGFIGSHTCVELLNAGYDVVIADNLYNASEKAVDRVKQITGKDLKFYKADIRDKEAMNEIFEKEEIESVIHFAGLKAVGESVVKPLEYYENNIAGTLVLCDVMRNHGVKNIIFSSSATVYGDPAFIPITEECPKGTCTNPCGWTYLPAICQLLRFRHIRTDSRIHYFDSIRPKLHSHYRDRKSVV